MSDLRESVENIVVSALNRQRDSYSDGPEPDSRVVTRDIILKVAEKLDQYDSFEYAVEWLRSQAPDSGEPK